MYASRQLCPVNAGTGAEKPVCLLIVLNRAQQEVRFLLGSPQPPPTATLFLHEKTVSDQDQASGRLATWVLVSLLLSVVHR